MTILQRYVFKELVRVFLLALVAFTAIFVLVGVVQEANHQGLSPLQTLAVVPYIIPTWLPFSIPTTLLLAVAVVYGRMAADNEIMATKAAGVSVLHVIAPALVLGVALSFFTLFLHDRVIPVSNLRMRTELVSNVEDMVYAKLRMDRVLKGPGMPYEIYVERVDDKKLINAVFKRKGSEGGYDQVVFARETELKFDSERRQVNVHMRDVQVTDGKGMQMETPSEKDFPVTLPTDVVIKPGIREMTLREIEQRKRDILESHEKRCAVWAFGALSSMATGRFDDVQWATMDRLAAEARGSERDILRLNAEPHLRRAVSFGCFAFVLLGCPVAIWFQRGDWLSAFFSCFMPIMVLYYPLVMFGMNLSKEGIAHPIVLWSGNALLAVLACLVFRPVLRH
jgi:lipopolysaccharide export system permease protein